MAEFQFIIDGYNLLHAAGLAKRKYALGALEHARENLLSLLRRLLTAREQERTIVVFDAAKRSPSLSDHALRSGNIRIFFSTQHENADSLIETLIEDHPTPGKLTVISSDHRIQRCARLHNALFLDSESFLGDLLLRPPKSHKPLPPHPKQTGKMTPAELEYWLREFGGFDPTLQSPHGKDKTPSVPPMASPPRKSKSLSVSELGKGSTSPPTVPKKGETPRPGLKAPGKGARRPSSMSNRHPPIFSDEWLRELQAWVDSQQFKLP